MKVLVVGASGVLGRALVPRLVEAGHAVQAASRQTGLDLLVSDLGSVVDGCEAVIHAATAIPRDSSSPGAWELNTQLRTVGTSRLLEACRAAGVQRYVQQSIVMAYADGGDAWLDEDTPFDPSPARAGLVEPVREMESLVKSSALSWCILRGGQFDGPGTAQDLLIERLVAGRVVVPCNGSHWISPIHPQDMASAVVAAVTLVPSANAFLSPSGNALLAPSGCVFNIVADPVRYADYVDHLATCLALPIQREMPPPRVRPASAAPTSPPRVGLATHSLDLAQTALIYFEVAIVSVFCRADVAQG